MNIRAEAAAKLYFVGKVSDPDAYEPAKHLWDYLIDHKDIKLDVYETTEKIKHYFELDPDLAQKWVWHGRYLAVMYPEEYKEWMERHEQT